MALTYQEQELKSKINRLQAEQIYDKMVAKRYGITISGEYSDEIESTKELTDYLIPDEPFERMSHCDMEKDTCIDLLIEKIKLL